MNTNFITMDDITNAVGNAVISIASYSNSAARVAVHLSYHVHGSEYRIHSEQWQFEDKTKSPELARRLFNHHAATIGRVASMVKMFAGMADVQFTGSVQPNGDTHFPQFKVVPGPRFRFRSGQQFMTVTGPNELLFALRNVRMITLNNFPES